MYALQPFRDTEEKHSTRSVLENHFSVNLEHSGIFPVPRKKEYLDIENKVVFNINFLTDLFFCVVFQMKTFERLCLCWIPDAQPQVTDSHPKFLLLSKDMHLQGSSAHDQSVGSARDTLPQNKTIRTQLIDGRITGVILATQWTKWNSINAEGKKII